jgi:hypothetical protein
VPTRDWQGSGLGSCCGADLVSGWLLR